ncbi:MAG: bifunctional UDP-N-acetylglucosamine diphosphorylase/glucosamine-1-phosphate N-acetyltransferase GlmU [Marinicaulis sp.]|nr:bifunctional UDP-N-acetylglucosamine diphosphorylase/glucosamine-1-phosphate N-acetyltransferase GlmU [Marinicaulis sp.]
MKSSLPKVLHEIGGRAMLGHVADAVMELNPQAVIVVTGKDADEIDAFAISLGSSINTVTQSPPLGTGHAVQQAAPLLKTISGAVLVLYADTPLVTGNTLKTMAGEINRGAAVAVLGFTPDDPGAYGRLKQNENGDLIAIIEANDASDQELAIRLCNSGVMAVEAEFLKRQIFELKNDNAKSEYYLTDLAEIAVAKGNRCAIVETDDEEVLGVNSRAELAVAEAVFQDRKRQSVMDAGATLIDPQSVFFSHDTSLGRDVTVEPNVVFGAGVNVGNNATIKAFSHIEGAQIADGASVGPFARLRPGASLSEGAKVGNFVEIKNAEIGAGAKVSHLTYIGDASIGAEANIGAGAITCNYDGFGKHKTTIGKNAFIGSNSSLVAPVEIGDGAYVGSGSVITKNVEPGDLAVARGRQAAIKDWATKFRQAHKK